MNKSVDTTNKIVQIDEIHMLFNKLEDVKMLSAKKMIGLSATFGIQATTKMKNDPSICHLDTSILM